MHVTSIFSFFFSKNVFKIFLLQRCLNWAVKCESTLKFKWIPVTSFPSPVVIWVENVEIMGVEVTESVKTHLRNPLTKRGLNSLPLNPEAPPGWLKGEHVGLMTWWLWVRSPVKANILSSLFLHSPLQKHVRKVVGGFGKKAVLVLVWESQETHVRHRPPWYDLSC